MEDPILFAGQNQTRLLTFIFVFALFAGLETLTPLRQLKGPRPKRWAHHLGLILIGNALIRFLVPVGTLFWAQYIQDRGFGLFSLIETPTIVKVVSAVIFLDLAIYIQHVAFHKFSWPWRLHRVHHYDTQFDVSTAIRFHPIEIILSQAIKLAVIALIGAPAMAVFLFEIILSSTSLFNHANISLPKKLDSFLRLFVVTPDMHRIHHSVHSKEMQSNFGFNLPIWDRLFKTYTPDPMDGHQDMKIGLKAFRSDQGQGLKDLLINPFIKDRP